MKTVTLITKSDKNTIRKLETNITRRFGAKIPNKILENNLKLLKKIISFYDQVRFFSFQVRFDLEMQDGLTYENQSM